MNSDEYLEALMNTSGSRFVGVCLLVMQYRAMMAVANSGAPVGTLNETADKMKNWLSSWLSMELEGDCDRLDELLRVVNILESMILKEISGASDD